MEKSPLNELLKIWQAIPLKLVMLLVVLSLLLKNPDGRAEFYPFSNYPMYSKFDDNDYFVYIADQNGEALPSKATFRITTPKIKKRFKKELGKVADKLDKKKSEVDGADLEAVAVTTLKTLTNEVPAHPRMVALSELQLIYVDLRREGDEIVIKERKIGLDCAMMLAKLITKLRPPVVMYGRWEAMLMRLGFAVLLWFNLPAFNKFPEQRTPIGLAAEPFNIDFTFVNDPANMAVLKGWLLPLLVVYVIGYVRWLPLLYMLVLSLAVGTLKNSQGGEISHRFQIITMILVVQCGWHLLCAWRWLAGRFFSKAHRFHHGWNVDRMEVFVSQSAIAAIYLTTGITKMIRSGGEWFWQIRHIGVDLQKTWGQDFYNTLSQDAPAWAVWIKDTVTTHPWVAVVLFAPGLLAEFGAVLGVYGRWKAFFIGSALVVLHLGAITVMKLEFEQNIYCLLIFFVNIPFLIIATCRWGLGKSSGRTQRVER